MFRLTQSNDKFEKFFNFRSLNRRMRENHCRSEYGRALASGTWGPRAFFASERDRSEEKFGKRYARKIRKNKVGFELKFRRSTDRYGRRRSVVGQH